MEQWKDIKDYEGLYQISNFGVVKSLRKNKIMKTSISNAGYEFVMLWKNGKGQSKSIHRLVLEAFIPNPDLSKYTDCDHIDNNKLNNNIDNLRWCTHKENLNKKEYKEKMSKSLKGKYNGWNDKPIQQLDSNSNPLKTYKSKTEAAKSLGVSPNAFRVAIERVLSGKSKKGLAYGFRWKMI